MKKKGGKNMKKRIISALITLPLLFGSINAFAETSSLAVTSLSEKKILVGDENGNLNLSSYVTRAEFAKMAVLAFNLDKEELFEKDMSEDTFSDITKSHWGYDYIMTAAGYGLINGFEDGTVRPDDNITYEQAVAMATRVLNPYLEYPTGSVGFALDNLFLDNVSASMGDLMTRLDTVNLIYNVSAAYADEDFEDDGYYPVSNSKGSGSYSGGYITQWNGTMTPAIGGSAESAVAGGGGSASYAPVPRAINPNQYYNTEEYAATDENVFKSAILSPLSTFSLDTDTASYSNMRRFIVNGELPPKGSIRSEELINYFDYDLPEPEDGTPFSVTTEIAQCPWNEENRLAMISVKGEEISKEEREAENLVFLIDVSGSMYSSNKLPLVKKSMSILLDNLDERDTISVVTYASGTEVKLSGAKASEREKIMDCINGLNAYGSTNGGAGLTLAYEQAEKFKTKGNNRIILCTDGDFNVGITSDGELKDVVTEKRESGIYLSILGFGMGNYKDTKMEIMADNGNGSYYYIDNLREAKKVLADEMTKTLYTIAKDVKFQVEFNPRQVKEYRLVGYENRLLNTEDFDNDKKDAGEIGAGACVTVLYEIVPSDGSEVSSENYPLRYQTSTYTDTAELMNIKVRYKLPNEDESILKEYPVGILNAQRLSKNFSFASALAELGMILNDSEYKGTSTYDSVVALAREGIDNDKYGAKTEFIQLADLLRYIDRHPVREDDDDSMHIYPYPYPLY